MSSETFKVLLPRGKTVVVSKFFSIYFNKVTDLLLFFVIYVLQRMACEWHIKLHRFSFFKNQNLFLMIVRFGAWTVRSLEYGCVKTCCVYKSKLSTKDKRSQDLSVKLVAFYELM